jgi:hypothetical protein
MPRLEFGQRQANSLTFLTGLPQSTSPFLPRSFLPRFSDCPFESIERLRREPACLLTKGAPSPWYTHSVTRPYHNTMAVVPEHFRFLDLPAESRVMVYERLLNRTRRIKFVSDDGAEASSFTFIITLAPTAILRTSRLIKEEAEHIIDTTTQRFLQPGGYEGPEPRIRSGRCSSEAPERTRWLADAGCCELSGPDGIQEWQPSRPRPAREYQERCFHHELRLSHRNGTRRDTSEQLRKWVQYCNGIARG